VRHSDAIAAHSLKEALEPASLLAMCRHGQEGSAEPEACDHAAVEAGDRTHLGSRKSDNRLTRSPMMRETCTGRMLRNVRA
jgi:hypothetical protein